MRDSSASLAALWVQNNDDDECDFGEEQEESSTYPQTELMSRLSSSNNMEQLPLLGTDTSAVYLSNSAQRTTSSSFLDRLSSSSVSETTSTASSTPQLVPNADNPLLEAPVSMKRECILSSLLILLPHFLCC
jgi:hypothetical protein